MPLTIASSESPGCATWWVSLGPKSGGNGLAGPSMSPKKNKLTTNMVSMAQATSGSVSRSRNLSTTATVKPARIRPHSRIEPSSADHIAAMLYSSGVLAEPTCWM